MLKVWDEGLLHSDPVGFAKLKASSLMINRGIDEWFTIYFENRPAGEVNLQSTFEPQEQVQTKKQKLNASKNSRPLTDDEVDYYSEIYKSVSATHGNPENLSIGTLA